ncbi:aminoglycoside phosphotransferase family protein [Loktanella sp. DSM 29012]|uniref:aminoglycoside phosphotransferase family protein n=1 Tax=Loktanella sp. DSM 29012 TaxID=1881056 RepID=UPI000B7DE89F|nr:phosphotransferase [Loktanella sp. DSM 29012]
MTDRSAMMTRFLTDAGVSDWAAKPIAADASSRAYARLTAPGGDSLILMDADPATGEDTAQFVRIARYLTDHGFCAPRIISADPAGFLLLSDLGQQSLAQMASRTPADQQVLYDAATDVLIQLDGAAPLELPQIDPVRGGQMVAITAELYAGSDPAPLVAAVQEALTRHAPLADRIALRDFHAENLIWRPQASGSDRVGLLDFQDACLAPRGYDLASLLSDIRRDVPADIIARETARFARATGETADDMALRLAVLGAQRNLRILGVFCRLIAGGKGRYSAMMPRVWSVLLRDLGHPALSELRDIVLRDIPAPVAP